MRKITQWSAGAKWWKALPLSMLLAFAFAVAIPLALADTAATVYTNPTDFETATQELGVPTVIDFEEIDASPINNTFQGREEFDGNLYTGQGVTFSNPNSYPLYISPGGLFWNASNSLSVGRFPFDPYKPNIFNEDDDLIITLDPPCVAVGFTFVDNGTRLTDEFVQFIDSKGNVVEQVGFPSDFTSYRAFVGIVSLDHPIATINIVEAPNDGDDVNYDDFTFFPVVPIIETTVDIAPDTLNLKSGGKWISAYIELPEGYDVADIDVSTVLLENTTPAELHPTEVGDYDSDSVPDLMVKFDRQALIEYLDGTTGEVTMTVSGELSDGALFEGSDTITVINPGKK